MLFVMAYKVWREKSTLLINDNSLTVTCSPVEEHPLDNCGEH